jgi:tRNA pseudouridine55 synthase
MSDCADCSEFNDPTPARWVAPRRQEPLSGILNVDKPPAVTSHDVVDTVRRLSGQRRVGHAGTLDPMATGVLLILLGRATRLSTYLMAGRKRYQATIVLGVSTDTYDAWGRVVSRGEYAGVRRDRLESALSGFVGSIDQVPPLYSALKRGGQPLYKVARQGGSVELEPRRVTIYEIALKNWSPPSLTIEVGCSAGTYIRSLAHDLGKLLGSGAHLAALVRLQSGKFALEDAVSVERLEEVFRYGQELEYLLPPDEALLDFPALILGPEDARRVVHGQTILAPAPLHGPSLRRAYSAAGDFLAVLSFDPQTGSWKPVQVFLAPESVQSAGRQH